VKSKDLQLLEEAYKNVHQSNLTEANNMLSTAENILDKVNSKFNEEVLYIKTTKMVWNRSTGDRYQDWNKVLPTWGVDKQDAINALSLYTDLVRAQGKQIQISTSPTDSDFAEAFQIDSTIFKIKEFEDGNYIQFISTSRLKNKGVYKAIVA
jgi:hypothetical protein